MKTTLFVSLLTLVAFALVGCGGSRAARSTPAEPPPAATYKEDYGLQLSAAGRSFIGLRTAEVVGHRIDGEAVAAIPVSALLRTVSGDFVYVANGDWFLRTSVTVARTDGTWVEVADGLYEGDDVVVAGARALLLAEIHAVNGGVGCADGH